MYASPVSVAHGPFVLHKNAQTQENEGQTVCPFLHNGEGEVTSRRLSRRMRKWGAQCIGKANCKEEFDCIKPETTAREL